MLERKALVIGATGLIGRGLVFELLKSESYSEVVVLSRRDLVIKHPKLQQYLIDFENLSDFSDKMNVTDVFCCMGSTQAKTPDENVYRKIDFHYPLQVAKIAKEQGAKQFHLVSSMGADVNSKLFYSRLKGEIEQAISELQYESYYIYRPSLLLGSRNESRPLETISQYLMRVLNYLFIGPLKKYRAIPGTYVSKAMLKKSLLNQEGKFTIDNKMIFELVEG
ncbi:MAG: NAD(P)H-binding protein [Bacteroidia bacterium]|nr:NAD(P)H-binding protein [Bacteroidia bacterium]